MNASVINIDRMFFSRNESVYTASVVKSFLMHFTIFVLVLIPIIAKHKDENERVIPISVSMVSVAAPNITQDLKKNSDKIKNLDAPIKEKPQKKLEKETQKPKILEKKIIEKTPIKTKSELPKLNISKNSDFSLPASMQKKIEEKTETTKTSKISEIKTNIIDVSQKVRESNINVKKQITANGSGNSASNVMPTLSEADYLSTTPPIYPPRAIDLGQQGIVIIRALISANGGSVQKVAIHKSSGFSILDNSALEAVKDWKFKPFTQKSIPISGWVMVPVRFVIR
ncbi:MAG: energy transducer TonB [Rickettsiales bacterium]|nr:energy transducer TonB [Rickettsiales bacterium]